MFFFSPVNIESVREPLFLAKVHGHKFAFTGTFLSKFTGKKMRSRALFWLFTGTFWWFTGTFWLFTGTFLVHGHLFFCSRALFLCSRAHFWHLFTGSCEMFTGIFLILFTGTFSRFTGKKNTVLMYILKLLNFMYEQVILIVFVIAEPCLALT